MKMEEFAAKENENPYALQTDSAERSMWLMKCPSLPSSSLKSLPFPDDPYLPVARVILSIDPLASVDDNETKVVMELAQAEFGNIPKRYAMDMYKDFVPMSVFCKASSHGELSVEGKIKNVCDMRLHNDNIESYGQLCRERASKTQVIDNATGMHMWPLASMINPTTLPETKEVTNKTLEMKRTRRDRREMEEVMLNLFERHSNWTLRELICETNQPKQFMKDMLRDLCIYNNKGSNHGTYELKPEYKKVPEE